MPPPTRSTPWLAPLVLGLALLWALLVSSLAIRQHEAFSNVGNDLGIYAQIVWTTGQGTPFYTSLTRQTTNFLGHHFVPIVAALVPLHALWPDARLLLVVQALALAAGVGPLLAFAQRRLPAGMALIVALAYLLSPFLASIALFEFHEIALAVLPLMAAGAALLERRPRATLLWLGIALLAKEEVALIAVGFGLYALLVQRRGRFGAALTGAALAWSLFLFGWLMPALNPLEGSYTFAQRYGSLGDSPAAILRGALTQPGTVLALLTTEAKRRFVGALLLPLGGLPLLGLPATLLALPTLAYLLLSDYELQVQLWSHYPAPLLPPLFLATVGALERLRGWHPRLGWAGAALLLAAALLGARLLGPLPGGLRYAPDHAAVTPDDHESQALLATLPPDAAVASDWRYFPWLANRWHIDDLLNPTFRPINSVIPDWLATRAPAPDATSAPTYPWIAPELSELEPGALRLPRFTLRAATPEGTQLWERRPPAEDVTLARLDAPFEGGLWLVAAGTPPEVAATGAAPLRAAPGDTLPIWLAWGASEPLPERLTFTVQLFRGEERVAQRDQEMGGGRFPTPRWHDWLAQPVVVGEFPLTLPADLPPGSYHLRAGAYESATVRPLLRPDGSAWVEVAIVEVEAEN